MLRSPALYFPESPLYFPLVIGKLQMNYSYVHFYQEERCRGLQGKIVNKYLLLTEFEVRTVSYAYKLLGPWINKKKQGSVTYSTDREKRG